MVWTTLAHNIDEDMLRQAFRTIRKSGAAGVDGMTAAEYAANLEENLITLNARFHAGTYRAPPVRRVFIPKADGMQRPIGIPTLEDKILQQAVAMVLGAVYEQDFLDCSYGFRPGRSAHQALHVLRESIMASWGGWVLELDIASFFDTMSHQVLGSFLDQRIRDGVIRRTIGKWLNAGVMEEGELRRSERGSPQGGVVSPLLSNIYLHHVLDVWFEQDVKPRLRGRATLVRYADDGVMVFEREDDARRVQAALVQRLAKYGLAAHPKKTRLVPFRQPRDRDPDAGKSSESFDFLGFTHLWARSRRGIFVMQRRTSKKSFAKSCRAIWQWCRRHRHRPIAEQRRMLAMKMIGHYCYFGVRGNQPLLDRFAYIVRRAWRYWLFRRSYSTAMTWDKFHRLLGRYPLPAARCLSPLAASP